MLLLPARYEADSPLSRRLYSGPGERKYNEG
jgi:hypothetical protein